MNRIAIHIHHPSSKILHRFPPDPNPSHPIELAFNLQAGTDFSDGSKPILVMYENARERGRQTKETRKHGRLSIETPQQRCSLSIPHSQKCEWIAFHEFQNSRAIAHRMGRKGLSRLPRSKACHHSAAPSLSSRVTHCLWAECSSGRGESLIRACFGATLNFYQSLIFPSSSKDFQGIGIGIRPDRHEEIRRRESIASRGNHSDRKDCVLLLPSTDFDGGDHTFCELRSHVAIGISLLRFSRASSMECQNGASEIDRFLGFDSSISSPPF
jgi:hypothetical protein